MTGTDPKLIPDVEIPEAEKTLSLKELRAEILVGDKISSLHWDEPAKRTEKGGVTLIPHWLYHELGPLAHERVDFTVRICKSVATIMLTQADLGGKAVLSQLSRARGVVKSNLLIPR